MKRLVSAAALAATVLLPVRSDAANNVPIAFAPGLGANPTRTQQKLAALEAKLPPSFALPATLVPLASGAVTLRFLPEAAAALERARTSGPGTSTWPGGVLCAKHAAFAPPSSLLAPGASAACSSAESSVRAKLGAVATCREVSEPERYVLAAPRGVVNDTTTGSIESLIALTGEVLSHYPTPEGLLPADFVPTLRSVVWKIRRAPLEAQIGRARASYTDALATLNAQAGCFDAAARASLLTGLAELDAELLQASAHVASVDAAGKARANQETVCLAARGRSRPALPLPSLTDDERRFVAFWLGGIMWRMRGGGLIPLGSTQAARTQFCERPLRRIGELAGGPVGEEAGYRVFLNVFGGWGEWMDMGTSPGGQDLYEDLVQMTDRGRQQVQDPASSSLGLPIPLPIGGLEGAVDFLGAKGFDTTALLTGGLEMGPCYAYALNPLRDFRYADAPMAPYGGQLVEGFTALGEVCTGASISLGLAATLLEGTPSSAPKPALCAGRACGDDGCGGSCGACPTGLACASGACVAPGAPAAEPAITEPAGSSAAGASASAGPTHVADGCACRASSASSSTSAAVAPLALAMLFAVRRRRRA